MAAALREAVAGRRCAVGASNGAAFTGHDGGGRHDRDRACRRRQGADQRGGRRDGAPPSAGASEVIGLPSSTKVWLAAGATDMRKGFDGLAMAVQTTLQRDPFSGHVFVFHGRRGDLIKVLWWSGDGLCLFAKRLERGRFVWPRTEAGTAYLTAAQLSMLLEGIDWR